MVHSRNLLRWNGICTSSYLMNEDELVANPFYNKYAEKIKQVQTSESAAVERQVTDTL